MDIEKLRHVLEHVLPRIAPAEFDMRKYVSQNDGSCGTVCCIAGWFPKHWPESGFTWAEGYLEPPPRILSYKDGLYHLFDTEGSLIGRQVIQMLFGLMDRDIVYGSPDPSLPVVRAVFAEAVRIMETEGVGAAHAFLSDANKISFLPFVSLRY